MTTTPPSPRVVVVGHRYATDRAEVDLQRALDEHLDVSWRYVEDGWPCSTADIPGIEEADVCLWFVTSRFLLERPAFDWRGWSGLRVLYEMDACQNYWQLAWNDRLLGAWPPVVRRDRFDLLVCTSPTVADRFRDDGVRAVAVPKGFAPSRFHDLGLERAGVGFYGQRYRSRLAVLARLRRAGLAPTEFACPISELNGRLNRFAGALICNMSFDVPPSGRIANRLRRDLGIRLQPGPEAMMKNFEVAGAGTAPICDAVADLDGLGFVDGESALVYRSIADLEERLRAVVDRPDELVRIGRAAAALVHARHTWDHRAVELRGVLLDALHA